MKKISVRFLPVILSVFLLIILVAACGELEPSHEVIIKDVAQVNWHEKTLYTFWVQKAGSSEIGRVTINFWDEPRRFADVPPGEKKWVKYTAKPMRGMSQPACVNAEIHLHSATDIKGAGWNHGKFGKGSISVIE